MSWLKTSGPLGGPEIELNLPTSGNPGLKGPTSLEKGLPGLEGPAKPPMGGPKPPMPGAGPMGGPMGPGAGPGAGGTEQVKQLLDKGDLKSALEALKKLVPDAGGPAGPGVGGEKPRAPFLGAKPESKPAPKKEGPEDKGDKPEAKSEDKKESDLDKRTEGALRVLAECGACHTPLVLDCPSCSAPLSCMACLAETLK